MALSEYSKYGSAAKKLTNAIKSDMVSHAYIIEGNNNVDKLGFAKEFAKALLCREKPAIGCGSCPTCRKIADDNYEDIYLVEPSWNDKKTKCTIRDQSLIELQSSLKNRPTGGERNIAIIESGDSMTPRAQNRFLKTLEEPHPGTVIMILSENTENFLPTINSRCIKCRLIDFDQDENSRMAALAVDIVDLIGENAFFYDISKKLDSKIKDSRDAAAFLDGMEGVFGAMLRNGDQQFTRQRLIRSVKFVEDAQTQIRRNISYKYSIRNLILKLEGK